jgi:integrase/recombinase XerD
MITIYLEQFSEWLMLKGFSSSTITSTTKTISHFIHWLTPQQIAIEQVSYNDVLAYISHCKKKGNQARTLQIITNALKHFYNCLQQSNHVLENPVTNINIQGIKRKALQHILTPEELETIYQSYQTTIDIPHIKQTKSTLCVPPQVNNELARRRNKIILGLLIYQGLRTEELAKLELQDLQLRAGKINIPESKRNAGRIVTLEAHQVYDLMDYIHQTRKQILAATNKASNKVFISVGSSLHFDNIIQKLIKTVQQQHPQVKDLQQIRTSVITNWLKIHNLRKVQYMAGHKYVSSTEAYQINNIEELQDDIKKYHPIG